MASQENGNEIKGNTWSEGRRPSVNARVAGKDSRAHDTPSAADDSKGETIELHEDQKTSSSWMPWWLLCSTPTQSEHGGEQETTEVSNTNQEKDKNEETILLQRQSSASKIATLFNQERPSSVRSVQGLSFSDRDQDKFLPKPRPQNAMSVEESKTEDESTQSEPVTSRGCK
eukprot:CAMPEP_0117835346 /NCGR_PEP_ID=MMETSP0949-20121206/11439_1 /TAXON_ID=44440 /ORGANISM="Chattonella subsalsa, Strain CCMP2191" /LENGTH=171 /DNA_ID=CAMNT_0005677335 /DNA_START=65 /DNA_END=577 /DNA_ORIENTATION=-